MVLANAAPRLRAPTRHRYVVSILHWGTRGAATFSTSVLPSFLGIAFSVHGTSLLSLSLQSFLCSSSTRCLRAWQFPLHFLVSESSYPHDVSCPLPHRLVGQR